MVIDTATGSTEFLHDPANVEPVPDPRPSREEVIALFLVPEMAIAEHA